MFIASIAHIIAFPVSPYLIDERLNWLSNIANAANVSDLSYEVRSHYDHFYGKVKSALRKAKSSETVANSNEDANEYTRLVVDTQGNYFLHIVLLPHSKSQVKKQLSFDNLNKKLASKF